MISGRRVLLGNDDVTMAVARPTDSMPYFYRNGQNYECYFVHEGRGTLHSVFGRLPFGPGDYLVIPYSVTWRMDFETAENRLLIFESREPGHHARALSEPLRPAAGAFTVLRAGLPHAPGTGDASTRSASSRCG